MEKIKLILSEMSDVISWKILNYEIDLKEEDFKKIDEFVSELEKMSKNKKENEYANILLKYNPVIEKVRGISFDNINIDIIPTPADKEVNKSNNGHNSK